MFVCVDGIKLVQPIAACIDTFNHNSPVCCMISTIIMASSLDSQKSQTSLPIALDVEHNKHEAETADLAPANHTPSFAEGGTRAWLVVVGCWCVAFASFGIVNTFGYDSSHACGLCSIPNPLQRLRDLLLADLSSRLFSLYCRMDRLYPSLGPALGHFDLRSHQ